MAVEDETWNKIVRALAPFGLDLSVYKPGQIKRRLETFLNQEGFATVDALTRALTQSPDLYRKLHGHLTIHVTEFFRDRPYWLQLRSVISHERLQVPWAVWSAGCSWGAEPVTAALIFEDMGQPYSILATDSDGDILTTARTGRYLDEQYRKVPPPYGRFFERDGDAWRLVGLSHGTITYRQHNLTAEFPPQQYNVVVCRNVLIYFEPAVRLRVLRAFADALTPRGLLFLGVTETFLEYADLGFRMISPSLYQKAD
ncbi:CheR family methyltransferase [Sulfobacillus harzensis]|uniref:Protein-glutamate O-methyltransferase CheR n=1 Tax=Sulfobacillus harzensis TaxID=2729629 RepID=A0A7Y0L6R0_9FIRM|nr:protein-glutamate O-methyltransferase CheR [Sulfobacillus harzensis]NMP24344.1 protein-glutamate O-methyltransferase CheR [Sulfobacillus harzensis]